MNERAVVRLIAVLIVLEAAGFGVLAAIHAGIPWFGIADPPARGAAIAEGMVTALFALCAAAVLLKMRWARGAAFLGHGIAVAVIMMGMANLALSRTTRSVANDYVYRVLLVVALLMLVFLLTAAARATLGQAEHRRPGSRTP